MTAAGEAQEWKRPHLTPFVPKSRSITFQQIDIEETSEMRHGPVLRVFGVTQEGHSVLAHIRHFLPYFWVAAPRGFTNNDCKDFAVYLNVRYSFPSVSAIKYHIDTRVELDVS